MKTALVTTTIHVPTALEAYLANFKTHGFTEDVDVIVIGDRKTPAEAETYCKQLADNAGTPIHYWNVARQQAWLKDLPELDALIPWNSVQRRNLAYLQAIELGAENIITIDDDNHVTDDDFLGGHAVIGEKGELPSLSSPTGWFNSSHLLVTDPRKPLYHRGYPLCKRDPKEQLLPGTAEGRVVVNAGLWLETADADAMSHLDAPCVVLGYRDGFDGRTAVAPGDHMVFNSQNTAFHRDTLAAMFLPPMGGKCGDLVVGRYDDIWMGMWLKVIADHLGDLITVGRPLVKQLRNDHDLIQDALVEIPAQRISNTMTRTLDQVTLTGSDYTACYVELIAQLRCALGRDGYSSDEQVYLRGVYDGMETWVKVCQNFSTANS